jgi:hypothetical protein
MYCIRVKPWLPASGITNAGNGASLSGLAGMAEDGKLSISKVCNHELCCHIC